ncbi:hypothetical protein WKR98_13240 [Pigmentiphaga sp. YJ18]|uniref:hypothetical protein n=1 Tax=Pigmentiphaga sp. YJ18 TaxID=3134907 RepID=UPI003112A997
MDRQERFRLIDPRIPLSWLIGGAIFVGWGLIQMWFTLNQLVSDVGKLSEAIKNSSEASMVTQNKLAIIEFRLGNVEYNLGLIGRKPKKPVDKEDDKP